MKRRILLLTPFAPARAALHGSAAAIHGLCSALADQHELMLAHVDRETDVDPELASRCVAVENLAVGPLRPTQRRVLALTSLARGRPQWAGEIGVDRVRRRVAELSASFRPHVVQAEHTVLADVLRAARPEGLKVVTIYDPAESWRRFTSLHERGPALAHRLDARAALRQQRRALALAHGVVVFTERDRQTLRCASPRRGRQQAELACIPLGWDVPATAFDPVGAKPPSVLFVGNFRHPPNREAALRLARSIFPRVLAKVPQARLEIIGPDPPGALRACATEHVNIPGAVPSVVPYLERATVVVAPMRLGGGMRVKVLEALAGGKAVVASSLAAEGLDVRDEKELILADTDEQTAGAICRVLSDLTVRRDLGAAARAWALGQLSWSATAARYESFYERLFESRAAFVANGVGMR